MIAGLIVIFSCALALLTVYRIACFEVATICFADGLLTATVAFIVIPLFLIVISGGYASIDLLGANRFDPFVNDTTTLNLLLGWAVVIAFQYTWHLFNDRVLRKRWRANLGTARLPADLNVMIVLLILFGIFTFFASGRSQGGHWQENISHAFSQNFLLIMIANFYNAFRAMFFGMLCYAIEKSHISKNKGIVIGAALVAFDVLLTFNRITAAYYFILLIFIFRNNKFIFGGLTVLLLPVVSYLSNLWGIIRGLALINGYSISGFIDAIAISLDAHSTSATATTIAEKSNSILETSNLQMFHNVVQRVPDIIPVLWGQTYILRPFAIFIPAMLWPSKPVSFNVLLGEQISQLDGLALNSTFFGEPYANFMYLWPLAFLFMITFFSCIFHIFSGIRYYFGMWSFFSAFAFARFDMGFVSICCVSIIAFICATRLAQLFSGRKALHS